jgi:hypothetical protein
MTKISCVSPDKQRLSDSSLWEISIYDYREVIQKCQGQFYLYQFYVSPHLSRVNVIFVCRLKTY